jgi:hypothetical protein
MSWRYVRRRMRWTARIEARRRDLAWGHVMPRIRIGLGGNPDFGRRKHERHAKKRLGLFARGPTSRFAAAAHGVCISRAAWASIGPQRGFTFSRGHV